MKSKTFGILQTIFAVGVVLWWAAYFAFPHPGGDIQVYESAFPLADLAWLTPLMVQAARANFRGSRFAPLWTAAAGGVCVFLGTLDFSFNIQHGVYALSLSSALLNGFINAASIAFGLLSIAWSKRRLSGQAQ